MKKLLFALCVLICSCSQNKEKNETSLLEQIHQDYVDSRKYDCIILDEDAREVDVYVKKGEKITDVTVVSKNSRGVNVVFDDYARIYMIFFQKGEFIESWGINEIRTDKRRVKVNVVQE